MKLKLDLFTKKCDSIEGSVKNNTSRIPKVIYVTTQYFLCNETLSSPYVRELAQKDANLMHTLQNIHRIKAFENVYFKNSRMNFSKI